MTYGRDDCAGTGQFAAMFNADVRVEKYDLAVAEFLDAEDM